MHIHECISIHGYACIDLDAIGVEPSAKRLYARITGATDAQAGGQPDSPRVWGLSSLTRVVPTALLPKAAMISFAIVLSSNGAPP